MKCSFLWFWRQCRLDIWQKPAPPKDCWLYARMNWPETKSAICNNANDTVIALLNYAWIRTKLDTYIDSITENFAIVNPFAEKEHVQCKLFYIHPADFYIWSPWIAACSFLPKWNISLPDLRKNSFKWVYAKNAFYSVLSKNAIYNGSVSTCPARPTL